MAKNKEIIAQIADAPTASATVAEPANNAAKEVAAEAPAEAVAVASTPEVKVEAPAAVVAAPEASINVDEVAKAARTEGYEAGVKAEQDRFKSLMEMAPDHAAFAIEQFAKGADVASASIQYTKLLAKELKEAKALGHTGGTKPIATKPAGESETPKADAKRPLAGLVKIAK